MGTKSHPVIVLDPHPQVDKWESEDEFEARLNRIQSKVTTPDGKPNSEVNIALDTEEVVKLKDENAQLKQLNEEARRRISQLQIESEKVLKRDADVETMLEEKSEHIRKLEARVNELEAKQSSGVTEEELIALHTELEREREMLEGDRNAMEQQFRQLELSMARERAEIARERNEMQRTKAELKLKLETLEKSIQREGSPLRRMREELRPEPASALPPGQHGQAGTPALQGLPALNRRAPENEDASKRSGILSRFLGKRND